MGQGPRRKKNDKKIVRVELPAIIGGGSQGKEFTNEMCLAAFEEEIMDSSPLIKDGLVVTLDEIENIFWVVLSGSKLKKLSKQHSTIVKKCKGIGIHYTGKIHITNLKKVYARFTRSL